MKFQLRYESEKKESPEPWTPNLKTLGTSCGKHSASHPLLNLPKAPGSNVGNSGAKLLGEVRETVGKTLEDLGLRRLASNEHYLEGNHLAEKGSPKIRGFVNPR